MRPGRMLAAAALILGTAWAARGDGALYQATVKTARADVRCGPNEKFYVTNHLPKGEVVQVVEEEKNGWVGIAPPRGSFSYINMRHLTRFGGNRPNTWLVEVGDNAFADVLVGSGVEERKPNKVGAQLIRGSPVTSLGLPKREADGDWLPIIPPAKERRYIRANDLERSPQATTGVAATKPPPAAPSPAKTLPALPANNGVAPPNPPAPVKTATRGVDPEFAEAQKLEHEGRTEEAIRVYEDLGRKYANADHNFSVQVYNKAAYLRRRIGVAAAPPPAGSPAPASREPRPPSAVGGLRPSGPGRLRRAQPSGDSQRAYYLESSRGDVLAWASAEPGVNLEPYVDRDVELLGHVLARGDVTRPVMRVVLVKPLR